MSNFNCTKSWSGNHSFEPSTFQWKISGELTKCLFCGFTLDTISLKEYIEQKTTHQREMTKMRNALVKQILKR